MLPESFGSDFFWLATGWGKVGVQRKEWGDLMASMTDARLPEQVMKMGRLDLPVLMIEGYGNWSFDGYLIAKWGRTNVRKDSIRKFLWKIQARGIWILQSDSQLDSVALLRALEEWTTKEDHSALIYRPGPKSPMGTKPNSRERMEWFLTGVEGVGPGAAHDLIEANGGKPITRLNLSRKQLLAIKGIGPSVVDKLWEACGPGPIDDHEPILEFRGKWRFLSNMYERPFRCWGEIFQTAEHSFQWAKTTDPTEKGRVKGAAGPAGAKKAGRKVTLRGDWEEVKEKVMLDVLRAKFQDEELGRKLLGTGNAIIEEGNSHGDVEWGVDVATREGKSLLGKLLMQVREELRAEEDA